MATQMARNILTRLKLKVADQLFTSVVVCLSPSTFHAIKIFQNVTVVSSLIPSVGWSCSLPAYEVPALMPFFVTV